MTVHVLYRVFPFEVFGVYFSVEKALKEMERVREKSPESAYVIQPQPLCLPADATRLRLADGTPLLPASLDWPLLVRQKEVLVGLSLAESLDGPTREAVGGVVHLLDWLQDRAAEVLGDSVVFGPIPDHDDHRDGDWQ